MLMHTKAFIIASTPMVGVAIPNGCAVIMSPVSAGRNNPQWTMLFIIREGLLRLPPANSQ
ncbi:MAG: hypothetical protein A2Y62_01265 [Candidatus Fischerbacteria bacterium RBG_13_37_8]|uniref:Uncharacterized protein n=1 Tax=Candidatus Fischerbacteria bacterium RBG_13_37_8 TaxID=1817863 RepID=A0A1F5VXQ7_9BACT|nr:MAG: hypothetical protein A2Y62_01265 [Candidatus Fischerbacteria bacterium RBG_13_37_8]